jgi:gliding motility-associated-like protein
MRTCFWKLLFLLIPCCFASSNASAQFIKDVYRFNNTLSVSPPDCGPDLVPTIAPGSCAPSYPSGGGFITDTIPYCGFTRTVYFNNLHWGLKYLNTAGTITNTYTIHIYLRMRTWGVAQWARIIDFSDGLSDNGIYFKKQIAASPDRCLDFYPNGIVGACPYFNTTNWYLLTFTRNGSTGMMYVYVNNTLFGSYSDVSGMYTSVPGKPVYIFRDDQPVACESGEANFGYLSFTNQFSNQAVVDSVYSDICNISSAPISANFSFSPDPPCQNQNVTVTYTGDIPAPGIGYNFNWQWNGASVISGSGMGPYVVSWNTPGSHDVTLTVTNINCGSQNTNTQQVFVGNPINTIVDKIICQGQSYLGYSSTGIYVDSFSSVNGCDSVRTLNLIVTPPPTTTVNQTICEGQSFLGYSTTGTYTDAFTTANGCDSIRVLNLTVNPKSYSTINQSICEGQSFLGYSTGGTYTDILIAANGCDSVRTINLIVKPRTYSSISQTICEGQSFLGYTMQAEYSDTLTSSSGCDSVRTLNLTVVKKPTVNLGADRELCDGDSLVLSPGTFSSYLWQDGSSLDYFVVTQPGTYSVTVSDSCGTAQDAINIIPRDCTPYFPSAFTPNRDGKNDLFKILNGYNITKYSLTVYNRWGEKVFQTKNPLVGWDGTISGQQQPAGVFVWYSSFTRNNKEVTMKGVMVLIR